MGEMGIWFRLADAVYLGGGHTPDVGGHNPMEPIRLGKPVVSSPDVFNFTDMMEDLSERSLIRLLKTPKAIGRALVTMSPPSSSSLDLLEYEADAPMQATLEVLRPLLPEKGLLE
jgi:3-deoxy-D-manno-octulosonic-acid transferase